MTKGDLIRMWAEFPDNTVLCVADPEGIPVEVSDIDQGFMTGSAGYRNFLLFEKPSDDE